MRCANNLRFAALCGAGNFFYYEIERARVKSVFYFFNTKQRWWVRMAQNC